MNRLAILLALGLSLAAQEVVVLRRFPVDSLDGIPEQKGLKLNRKVTAGGQVSVEVRARESSSYVLYEIDDLDVESARLVYRAMMRTRNVKGAVVLELVCEIPGRGTVSVEGRQYSLSGTTGWTAVEASFLLRKNENPDNVKLGAAIEGSGRFWIDEIRLEKEPLPAEDQ